MRASTIFVGFVLLAGCAKPPSIPPSEPQPVDEGKPADEGKPDVENETAERPGLTAAACEEQGGQVVGDIGDGAIHKPDYRCPDSGEAPIGSIIADPKDPDAPVAVEGSVCCK